MNKQTIRYFVPIMHLAEVEHFLNHGVTQIQSQVQYNGGIDWCQCDIDAGRQDVVEEIERLGGEKFNPG
ncbi:MAG: hypothetical protein KGI75_16325 [Rhizobiaceae bacterium]|nr:hypothetical protein [Rhizobiaceae bacterium]